MAIRYQLRRNSAEGSTLFKPRYANRMCDEDGRVLFCGETPNRNFRGEAEFSGPADGPTYTFRRVSRFTRRKWALDDGCGRTLLEIACPIAARFRPEAVYRLELTEAHRRLEIVPARLVTDSAIDRLVSCLGAGFVVRENAACIAYTGTISPGDGEENYARRAVKASGGELLDAIKDIPRRFRQVSKGNKPDDVAESLTVTDTETIPPEVALALLIFQVYVFKEIEIPSFNSG